MYWNSDKPDMIVCNAGLTLTWDVLKFYKAYRIIECINRLTLTWDVLKLGKPSLKGTPPID